MDIVAFAGCAVVISVLALILRQQKPEMGLMITIASGAVLLAVIISQLAPVLSELQSIISGTDAGEYFPVVFKALGICIVTQLASDICRDSGQQTIAANVETAGKIAMLIAALPLLSSVLATAAGIIRG